MRILITIVAAVVFTASIGAADLKQDEQVMLYPALASRAEGGWRLELHGIVFEPEKRRLMMASLRKALDIDKEHLSPAEIAIFNERCRHFLVDNERGKKFTVEIDGGLLSFGTSAADGHFHSSHLWKTGALDPSSHATNGIQTLTLPVRGANRSLPLQVHLLDDTGVSVISDIDDTIKISEVLDKSALLKNTFCRPFKPVPGMADVYRGWEHSHGASFHYVTASPWQLYAPLSDFTRSNGFPAGTWHMKEFRVKDRSFLKLFGSPERYKPGVIEPLLRKFPRRQFVLVGDSGEKDPEIYGALARKHPGQIRRIFIRDVTGESAGAPRYHKAFRGVPEAVWQVFREPSEMGRSLPGPLQGR